MDPFEEVLDALEIKSKDGKRVKFWDENELLRMFQKEYKDWPAACSVVRIPPLPPSVGKPQGLRDTEVKKDKGIEGEDKIYNYFVEAGEKSSHGLLLFPSVKGEYLLTNVPMFEIDLVVVHPKKGIFIVSVKNSKSFNNTEEIKRMDRHAEHIKKIRDYKLSNGSDIPIYGILCSIEKDAEPQSAPQHCEKFWCMNQCHLSNFKQFESAWESILVKERRTVEFDRTFQVFVSRLYTFVSKEKTTEIDGTETYNAGSSLVCESYQAPAPISVIIWSRQQMKVISRVLDTLSAISGQSIRIFVHGPKNCGKTLLLVYLAKMAEAFIRVNGSSTSNSQIIVCDRNPMSAGNRFLTEALYRTNIHVEPPSYSGPHFAMALYDNFDPYSVYGIRASKHSIIFSSESNIEQCKMHFRSFEFMKLDA